MLERARCRFHLRVAFFLLPIAALSAVVHCNCLFFARAGALKRDCVTAPAKLGEVIGHRLSICAAAKSFGATCAVICLVAAYVPRIRQRSLMHQAMPLRKATSPASFSDLVTVFTSTGLLNCSSLPASLKVPSCACSR